MGNAPPDHSRGILTCWCQWGPLPSLLLWGVWLTWASLWWNRGFYPFDHGYESTISYMWLHGLQPYGLDHYHNPVGPLGHVLFALLIKLFGPWPFVERLLFVLVYGLLAWLTYRLLALRVPRWTAWAVVVPTILFVVNMTVEAHPYYWWTGVLLSLAAVWCLLKGLAEDSRRAYFWMLGSSLLAIAAFALYLVCAMALAAAWPVFWSIRLALGPHRRRAFRLLLVNLAGLALFAGAYALWLQAMGWLPGYLSWLASLGQYFSSYYADPSAVVSHEKISFWYAAFFRQQSKARGMGWQPGWFWALAAPLSFSAALLFLRGLAGMGEDRARHAYRGLAVLFWTTAAAILAWLVLDPRICLEFFARQKILIDLLPPLALILCLWMAAGMLWGELRQPDRTSFFAWLLYLLVGGALWLAMALSHRRFLLTIAALVFLLPCLLAYVWDRLPRVMGFSWPRGLGVLLAVLGIVFGVGFKVENTRYEDNWFRPAPYFKYPALKYMRSSRAEEMDKVLFLASSVVQGGGKILVYPDHLSLYPLVGALPPVPIPRFASLKIMAWYPRDELFWSRVMQGIDQPPPKLIILQAGVVTSWRDWKTKLGNPTPGVIEDVVSIALGTGVSHFGYQEVFTGKDYRLFLRDPDR